MHNIWLIARREYLERIRTKAFLVATILIPLLMGGFVFGSGYPRIRAQNPPHTSPSSRPIPTLLLISSMKLLTGKKQQYDGRPPRPINLKTATPLAPLSIRI